MNNITSIDVQHSWGSIPTPKGASKIEAGISVLYYLAKLMDGKLKLEKENCLQSITQETMQNMIEKELENTQGIAAKEKLLQFFRQIFADSKNCNILNGWITGYYDSLVNYQNQINSLLSKYKQALAKLEKEEDLASGVEDKAADAKAKMIADQKLADKYWKLAAKESWKHPIKAGEYAVLAMKYECDATIQAIAYAADEIAIKFLQSEIVKMCAGVNEAKGKLDDKKNELIKQIKQLMANSNNITPQQLQQLQQDFDELISTMKKIANNDPFVKAAKWITEKEKSIDDSKKWYSWLEALAFGGIGGIFKKAGGDKWLDKEFAKAEKRNKDKHTSAGYDWYKIDGWIDTFLKNLDGLKVSSSLMSLLSWVNELPNSRLTKAINNFAKDGLTFVQENGLVDELVNILNQASQGQINQAMAYHQEAMQRYLKSSSDIGLISNIIQENTDNNIKA